jgi:dynein assembly factor 1
MSTTELDRQLQASVQKREAVKEKAYQEERAKYEEEFFNEVGMGGSDMTPKELRKIVDSDRRMYYRTDELNDKLYIHYKGWRELKNLDTWTGLKSLYADCNAFSYISGLQNCTKLRSLFLQDNCIKHISGLENCPDMWTINLSGNFIERIEGLENLKGLNSLIISKNKIGFNGVADIEKLVDTNIVSLDIQENRIEDPDCLPEVFARMHALRVLYLKGNGCAKKIVNYRKSITVYCKDLRYLDDRPVFEDDRRAAEAFNRGGLEEQRAEQRRMKEEKNQKHENNMRAFQQMIEDSRQQKKEYLAMRLEEPAAAQQTIQFSLAWILFIGIDTIQTCA